MALVDVFNIWFPQYNEVNKTLKYSATHSKHLEKY